MTVKKKPVGLTLEPQDHARLQRWAKARNRSMANAAAFIVTERLELDEQAEQLRALQAEHEHAGATP